MKLALGRYADAVHQRAAGLAPAVERIWSRDATFWGGDAARRSSVANRLGWLDVADHMLAHADGIEAFAHETATAGFTDAVVLGMGGSSLAPEVLARTIADPGSERTVTPHPRLHVLDTTDPATILAVRRAVDIERTLFFVSSKSGTTIEANTLFEYFHEEVAAVKEAAGGNFVAITDEGTPLQRLSAEQGFRRVFVNPSDIGGRYSALSNFGLVPAAVAGVDIRRLLERGVAEAAAAGQAGSEALTLGAALGELALAGRDKCTLILSPGVAAFGLWAEQLIAESTGKEGRGILPVDAEPLGSPGQYGDDRFFVYLRLEADNSGQTDATVGALQAEGFPVIAIELDDAYDLGREFFRWEFAVAVAGQLLGINPFDEPNVQESKDNTNRVLREFEATGRFDEHAALDPAAAIRTLAGTLTPPAHLAITAYIPNGPHPSSALNDVRACIRDVRHVATTLGFGPRFLHSTGQLHKGGPPHGSFLQLTADDDEDVAIPGRPYTFGQLKRAQAIGDFESLAGHGRPVVRVHLGSAVREIDGRLMELLDAARSPYDEKG